MNPDRKVEFHSLRAIVDLNPRSPRISVTGSVFLFHTLHNLVLKKALHKNYDPTELMLALHYTEKDSEVKGVYNPFHYAEILADDKEKFTTVKIIFEDYRSPSVFIESM